jgi:rRNA processing protein Gar1
MMLRVRSLMRSSAAYSVVVLPEPVGPVTSRMPFGDMVLGDGVHAERVEVESPGLLVEQAQHDAFAVSRGNGRDADVHRAAGDTQRDATVLRQALFRDIEPRHDLDAGDDQRRDCALGLQHLSQHAVDAEADHQPVLERLDVDVRRVLLHRLRQQRVDQADDRGFVLALEQVGLLRDVLGEVGEVGFLIEPAHRIHRRAGAGLVGLAQQQVEALDVHAFELERSSQVPPDLGQRERRRAVADDHVGALFGNVADQHAMPLGESERQRADRVGDPVGRGHDRFVGRRGVHGLVPGGGGGGTAVGCSPNGVVGAAGAAGSGESVAGVASGATGWRAGFNNSGGTSCSSAGSVGWRSPGISGTRPRLRSSCCLRM